MENKYTSTLSGSKGLSNPLLTSTLLTGQGHGSLGVKKTVPESPPRKRKTILADKVESKKTRENKELKLTLLSNGLQRETSLLSGTSSMKPKSLEKASLMSSLSPSLSKTDNKKATSLLSTSSRLGLNSGSSLLGRSDGKTMLDTSSFMTSSKLHSNALGSFLTTSLHSQSQSTQKSSLLTSSGLSQQKSNLMGSSLGNSLVSSGGKVSMTTSLNSSLTPGNLGTTLGMGSKLTTGLTGTLTMTSSLLSSTIQQPSGYHLTEESSGKKGDKSRKRARVSKYEAPPPQYELANEIEDVTQIELPRFIPPEQDHSLVLTGQKLLDVNGLKFALINAVSGSLICQPNFSISNDPTRVSLVTMSEKVICYDPEFILKVALYTRKQLNIRTTGNFLLAMAAHMKPCRPYLKKYFSPSIALPSDWIEVAEIYQAFPDKSLPLGSLPSALRRAMMAKFPDFDKYQLAKYNKESSQKKKKKKKMKKAEESGDAQPSGRGGARGRGGTRGGRGGARGGRGGARGRGRGGASGSGETATKTLFDGDSSSSSSSEYDSDEEYEKFKKEQAEKQLTSVVLDTEETPQQLEKMIFTLKQLIRKLHIMDPVEHVMCLIGKKYPMTLDEFYQSRLPGTFEEERAGKRMKLPVPETWETQVSLKGNKASTWEQLLDNKKLPFMAMLRNLRNLIKAGISRKHHNMVIRRLTDERSVISSKQFPFRFFSAYEVLDGLLKDFEKTQKAIIEEAEAAATSVVAADNTMSRGRGRGRGRGSGRGKVKLTAENWWVEKCKKKDGEKNKPKETLYDAALIQRYRKALDTAVKLATVYNVQPIRGRTVILCDVGTNMEVPCTAARGLGKPRTMKEVSVLLGLMCKYSCEDCTLVIFDSALGAYTSVELNSGTILENMEVVLNQELTSHCGNSDFNTGLPTGVLMDKLRDRIQMDNLLVLTGNSTNSAQQRNVMATYLESYRRLVNPSILYVNVSFEGKSCGFATEIKPEHENNIYISGFSDQILRFIAERGEGGQLRHVEKIDEAFNLTPLPPSMVDKPAPPQMSVERPLPVVMKAPSWRTVRVFISSTFKDMHGERDLLTRFVFPELRALGKKHFINVHEVDLRWGVTEEDTRSNKTLELCLTEIERCQLFIGMLGERYGWVPDKYSVPDLPKFDWLKDYPAGRSVTELEMHAAALSQPNTMKDRAFFFLRDSAYAKNVPKSLKRDFESESPQHEEKIKNLKNKICHSGLEVFENYPCEWGGVVDGKPIVSGLDQFGLRALNNLWNAIQKLFPEDEAVLDEMDNTNNLHAAYVANLQQRFVGRKKLVKDTVKEISHKGRGIINMTGKPGTGKSALLASIMTDYSSQASVNHISVLAHFVGAAPGSTNIVATLRRLCHDLNQRFNLQMDLPEDYKNLVAKFGDILKEASVMSGSPLVLFVDNVDSMEPVNLPHNLDWIPAELPENVVFVLTSLLGGKLHDTLKRLKVKEVIVEGLDMWDKTEVVRSQLATHRKSLDESPFNNQMKLLVSKKEANVPLYLRLACEELRVFGLFEKITHKLKSLPHTVPLLLQEVMSRIESDVGTSLTSAALILLVCCRDGLTAEELHDVLNLYKNLEDKKPALSDILNMKPTPDQCVPMATIAQLQTALQSFVNPTDSWNSRLTLSNGDIITAVRQRYLKGANSMETELFFHRLLAGFFYNQANPNKDGTWNGKSARSFKELPYHLAKGGCYSDLHEVVCNLQFIYNKCMLGMATQLLEDYQPQEVSTKSQEREQAKFYDNPTFQEFKSFVSRNLHILSSHPALTWQQAYNESSSTRPYQAVHDLLASGALPRNQTSLLEWQSKPSTLDPCYLTLANLPQVMTCVTISSNNMYFAGGSEDGLVTMFDLSTGKELKTFRGHADSITDVCFAGSNKLCSASLDNTVSIWDVADGHRIFCLKKHQRRVNSCSSDLSGKLLATASWDCCIQVISVNKGDGVCDFKVGSPVNCVSFHPEGQLIVSGQWDSTIKIWDIFHKTKKAVLRGHKSSVRDIAYSPSGNYIASAAMDGDVKLWAAYSGAQVGNIEGHALPINKLTFSPTGKELVTVSDDHKIKIWSGHLGKPISTLGDEEMGPAMSVSIATNQETVAIGYHSGFVRQFDIVSGYELSAEKVHSASIRCIKYLPHGYIVSGSDDNQVMILRDNLTVACALTTHEKPVMSLDVSKSFIATTSEDCTCRLFDNYLKTGTKGIKKSGTIVVSLRHHTGPVTSCSFNKDGSRLATGSRDMTVHIYDILAVTLDPESAAPLMSLPDCHSDWISDAKWSDIGDTLVTASVDFNLKVWDIKSCKEKVKMTGHQGAINHVAYSNGCIISTCADGSAKVWSHRGTEITTLYGHTQRANGCDISVSVADEKPDEDDSAWSEEKEDTGKVLQPKLTTVIVATCSDDGTVRLWYPLQANELACLTGHSEKVVSVATQTNGSICTSSRDQSVKLWTYNLEENNRSLSHNASVTFVANNDFSQDGLAISGSRDGEVKLWQRSAGQPGGTFLCPVTFKAHQKAVTCGTWLSRQLFVTGSDDETVSFWKLTSVKGQLSCPRKVQTFNVKSPILSVASNGNESRPIIVTSDWNGNLSFFSPTKKMVVRFTYYSFTSWLLRLQWLPGNKKTKILATTTDGYVQLYNVGSLEDEDHINDVTSLPVPLSPVEMSKQEIASNTRESTWVLDATRSESHFYTVDSLGQVSFVNQQGVRVSKKIHASEATCVLSEGDFVFTASKDKTIKVWNKSFEQVGLFFCQSPVTSMTRVGSYPGTVQLMVGNELGFVHLLHWRA